MAEIAAVAVEPDRVAADILAGLAELDAGKGIAEAEAEALFDQLER